MNIFKIDSLMLAFLFGIANSGQAQVVLDQSFDAIAENPFNPGRSSLTATQSLTQTFTVGQAGLLFQIDVQVNYVGIRIWCLMTAKMPIPRLRANKKAEQV